MNTLELVDLRALHEEIGGEVEQAMLRVVRSGRHIGGPEIAAFEAASGQPRWKTPRPNLVGGYATPVLHGKDILTSGPMELVSYAADTGARRWSIPKMGVMPVASPIWVFQNIDLLDAQPESIR